MCYLERDVTLCRKPAVIMTPIGIIGAGIRVGTERVM
jgi:hypothetical protein